MTSYARDINAWSIEQAAYLRESQLDKIDFVNVAEEILDISRREKRELKRRLAIMLCTMIKIEHHPEHYGLTFKIAGYEQHKAINHYLEKEAPSLTSHLRDPTFIEAVWSDAVILVIKETGIVTLPEKCPWDLVMLLKG